jgi:hypothetical protein
MPPGRALLFPGCSRLLLQKHLEGLTTSCPCVQAIRWARLPPAQVSHTLAQSITSLGSPLWLQLIDSVTFSAHPRARLAARRNEKIWICPRAGSRGRLPGGGPEPLPCSVSVGCVTCSGTPRPYLKTQQPHHEPLTKAQTGQLPPHWAPSPFLFQGAPGL